MENFDRKKNILELWNFKLESIKTPEGSWKRNRTFSPPLLTGEFFPLHSSNQNFCYIIRISLSHTNGLKTVSIERSALFVYLLYDEYSNPKVKRLTTLLQISNQRQELPAFLDPDRQQSGEYQLVHREDTKSCPKSVSRCQQCRIAFQSSDVVLIKTTGVREITDKDGKQKRYMGNIYLHYLTKCLKSYDQKFDFLKVNAPKKTQELLPARAVESLRTKGLTLVQLDRQVYLQKQLLLITKTVSLVLLQNCSLNLSC